ncbi:MAG: hypothetical protein BWY11_02232 [Firmicutes bacterium ADurb.Bin182]|nr:MAG: hypothetical protein BWY11_02232 [Firmicutes bacterium ADurb.Bin182]
MEKDITTDELLARLLNPRFSKIFSEMELSRSFLCFMNTSGNYTGSGVKSRSALSSKPAFIEHMGISFLATKAFER